MSSILPRKNMQQMARAVGAVRNRHTSVRQSARQKEVDRETARRIREMVKQQQRYAFNPELWAREVIGFEPDVWQAKAMQNFIDYRFLAISTGTGTGKTAFAAIMILFFLANRPFPKVACTAPSAGQLEGGLWAECAKWQKKSAMLTDMFKWTQRKIAHRRHPENWFAIARTSRLQAKKDTTESLQGLHEEHIMTLCDEASGVPDQVMNALDGASTTPGAYALLISNPTRRSGYFYRILKNPELQVEHGGLFKVMYVSAEEAKYCDEIHIRKALNIYGRESNFYRTKVLGLPPKAESDALIAPDQVYGARQRGKAADPPATERVTELNAVHQIPDQTMISCDPARFGDDETVFYVRIGQRIVARYAHNKMDNVEVAAIGFRLIKQYRPDHIAVDTIGIGSGVYDVINHLIKAHNRKYINDPRKHIKVKMHDIHIGGKPLCKRVDKEGKVVEAFLNLRAELWWSVRQHIDMVAIEPPSEKLDDELQSLTYDWDLKDQRMKIISKKQLREVLNRSPNDADAFALLFYPDLLKMAKKVIMYKAGMFALGSANSIIASRVRSVQAKLLNGNELGRTGDEGAAEENLSMLSVGRGRAARRGRRLGVQRGSSFASIGAKKVGISRYSHLSGGWRN